MLEICQEDNLTQRRKDAKKNQVFRTEDAKIFGLNCGFALAILTLLGNESALPLSPHPPTLHLLSSGYLNNAVTQRRAS